MGCVVVDIPAGALEVQARSGQWALQDSVALGALKLRLGGEVLYLFKAMATLGAAIGIQRQSSLPFQGEMTHTAYCIGRAEILRKTAPPFLGLACFVRI